MNIYDQFEVPPFRSQYSDALHYNMRSNPTRSVLPILFGRAPLFFIITFTWETSAEDDLGTWCHAKCVFHHLATVIPCRVLQYNHKQWYPMNCTQNANFTRGAREKGGRDGHFILSNDSEGRRLSNCCGYLLLNGAQVISKTDSLDLDFLTSTQKKTAFVKKRKKEKQHIWHTELY